MHCDYINNGLFDFTLDVVICLVYLRGSQTFLFIRPVSFSTCCFHPQPW